MQPERERQSCRDFSKKFIPLLKDMLIQYDLTEQTHIFKELAKDGWCIKRLTLDTKRLKELFKQGKLPKHINRAFLYLRKELECAMGDRLMDEEESDASSVESLADGCNDNTKVRTSVPISLH